MAISLGCLSLPIGEVCWCWASSSTVVAIKGVQNGARAGGVDPDTFATELVREHSGERHSSTLGGP